MKPNIFYHVTTNNRLELIQKEGLRPVLGTNSMLVGETKGDFYDNAILSRN